MSHDEEDFFDLDSLEEPSEPVRFYSEDIDFTLSDQIVFQSWIERTVHHHGGLLSFLNFIFCSDEYLHKLNMEYLHHDTLTDIITFPYQDYPTIEGDIFISVDRVRENARTYGVSFQEELSRVMAHGVLHLCGFGDKSEEEQSRMRSMEEEALRLFHDH